MLILLPLLYAYFASSGMLENMPSLNVESMTSLITGHSETEKPLAQSLDAAELNAERRLTKQVNKEKRFVNHHVSRLGDYSNLKEMPNVRFHSLKKRNEKLNTLPSGYIKSNVRIKADVQKRRMNAKFKDKVRYSVITNKKSNYEIFARPIEPKVLIKKRKNYRDTSTINQEKEIRRIHRDVSKRKNKKSTKVTSKKKKEQNKIKTSNTKHKNLRFSKVNRRSDYQTSTLSSKNKGGYFNTNKHRSNRFYNYYNVKSLEHAKKNLKSVRNKSTIDNITQYEFQTDKKIMANNIFSKKLNTADNNIDNSTVEEINKFYIGRVVIDDHYIENNAVGETDSKQIALNANDTIEKTRKFNSRQIMVNDKDVNNYTIEETKNFYIGQVIVDDNLSDSNNFEENNNLKTVQVSVNDTYNNTAEESNKFNTMVYDKNIDNNIIQKMTKTNYFNTGQSIVVNNDIDNKTIEQTNNLNDGQVVVKNNTTTNNTIEGSNNSTKEGAFQDIPKKTNYVTKYIESCPESGYFLKKDTILDKIEFCYLCFCKENNTAICWPRDNKKCDNDHYFHNGVMKRKQRKRRSLFSINEWLPSGNAGPAEGVQECKPHESSKSEGCPPADWCVGCTVCDCNSKGQWECHLLSFCTEDDKKRQKLQQMVLASTSPKPDKYLQKIKKNEAKILADKIEKDRRKKKIGKNLRKHFFTKDGKLINRTLFDLRKRKKSVILDTLNATEVERLSNLNMKVRKINNATKQKLALASEHEVKKVTALNMKVKGIADAKVRKDIAKKQAKNARVLAKREPPRKKRKEKIYLPAGFKLPENFKFGALKGLIGETKLAPVKSKKNEQQPTQTTEKDNYPVPIERSGKRKLGDKKSTHIGNAKKFVNKYVKQSTTIKSRRASEMKSNRAPGKQNPKKVAAKRVVKKVVKKVPRQVKTTAKKLKTNKKIYRKAIGKADKKTNLNKKAKLIERTTKRSIVKKDASKLVQVNKSNKHASSPVNQIKHDKQKGMKKSKFQTIKIKKRNIKSYNNATISPYLKVNNFRNNIRSTNISKIDTTTENIKSTKPTSSPNTTMQSKISSKKQMIPKKGPKMKLDQKLINQNLRKFRKDLHAKVTQRMLQNVENAIGKITQAPSVGLINSESIKRMKRSPIYDDIVDESTQRHEINLITGIDLSENRIMDVNEHIRQYFDLRKIRTRVKSNLNKKLIEAAEDIMEGTLTPLPGISRRDGLENVTTNITAVKLQRRDTTLQKIRNEARNNLNKKIIKALETYISQTFTPDITTPLPKHKKVINRGKRSAKIIKKLKKKTDAEPYGEHKIDPYSLVTKKSGKVKADKDVNRRYIETSNLQAYIRSHHNQRKNYQKMLDSIINKRMRKSLELSSPYNFYSFNSGPFNLGPYSMKLYQNNTGIEKLKKTIPKNSEKDKQHTQNRPLTQNINKRKRSFELKKKIIHDNKSKSIEIPLFGPYKKAVDASSKVRSRRNKRNVASLDRKFVLSSGNRSTGMISENERELVRLNLHQNSSTNVLDYYKYSVNETPESLPNEKKLEAEIIETQTKNGAAKRSVDTQLLILPVLANGSQILSSYASESNITFSTADVPMTQNEDLSPISIFPIMKDDQKLFFNSNRTDTFFLTTNEPLTQNEDLTKTKIENTIVSVQGLDNNTKSRNLKMSQTQLNDLSVIGKNQNDFTKAQTTIDDKGYLTPKSMLNDKIVVFEKQNTPSTQSKITVHSSLAWLSEPVTANNEINNNNDTTIFENVAETNQSVSINLNAKDGFKYDSMFNENVNDVNNPNNSVQPIHKYEQLAAKNDRSFMTEQINATKEFNIIPIILDNVIPITKSMKFTNSVSEKPQEVIKFRESQINNQLRVTIPISANKKKTDSNTKTDNTSLSSITNEQTNLYYTVNNMTTDLSSDFNNNLLTGYLNISKSNVINNIINANAFKNDLLRTKNQTSILVQKERNLSQYSNEISTYNIENNFFLQNISTNNNKTNADVVTVDLSYTTESPVLDLKKQKEKLSSVEKLKTQETTFSSKRKFNSYDIKKVSPLSRKFRLRKIVTLFNKKPDRDERVYVPAQVVVNNNTNAEIASEKKYENVKNFFKKLIKGLRFKKSEENASKTRRFKVLKYLQKFFKKLFSSDGKHAKKKSSINPKLNKKNIIETLCATFGPCNINFHNKAKLRSQINHLNDETYNMLSSIKVIKGLLNLINFTNIDKEAKVFDTKKSRFKNNVQKLHAILKNTYVDKDHLDKLNDIQKTQIAYIKNNTQKFIRSAAKFTMVLNDIINMITATNYITVDDYNTRPKKSIKLGSKLNTNSSIIARKETNKINNSNETLEMLKDLVSKYNLVQKKFMRKMYKILSNFNSKEDIKTNIIEKASQNLKVQNKTEAIQRYTKNIIENLRNLKNLAQNMNGNTRTKRDARDEESLEYLLMLMEYLLKQNRHLDTAPVNDGIDLLIEAIRSAPDIKYVPKKVLNIPRTQIVNQTLNNKLESIEVNGSREENSHSKIENNLSKEDITKTDIQDLKNRKNASSHLKKFKLNIIDQSFDYKGADDYILHNRRAQEPPSLLKTEQIPFEDADAEYKLRQDLEEETTFKLESTSTQKLEIKQYDEVTLAPKPSTEEPTIDFLIQKYPDEDFELFTTRMALVEESNMESEGHPLSLEERLFRPRKFLIEKTKQSKLSNPTEDQEIRKEIKELKISTERTEKIYPNKQTPFYDLERFSEEEIEKDLVVKKPVSKIEKRIKDLTSATKRKESNFQNHLTSIDYYGKMFEDEIEKTLQIKKPVNEIGNEIKDLTTSTERIEKNYRNQQDLIDDYDRLFEERNEKAFHIKKPSSMIKPTKPPKGETESIYQFPEDKESNTFFSRRNFIPNEDEIVATTYKQDITTKIFTSNTVPLTLKSIFTSTDSVDQIKNNEQSSSYDIFNGEADDSLNTYLFTTHKPTKSTNSPNIDVAIITQVNSKKNYDDSVSISKSKIDWLDETYEEEIKPELNMTQEIEANKLETSTQQEKRVNDVSGLSKESLVDAGTFRSNTKENKILYKKELDFLNSLDYGVTEKSKGEASKESDSNVQFSAESLNTYN